jgi:prolactin regulatory element-binding protein
LRWKEKLTSAGMWAVEEGETVLKGIFFSEAAGIVGQMAQAAMSG